MPNVKILLVDDDQELSSALAKVLRMYNFEATTAATMPEALKRISSDHFDVLLSDLHLPGAGDGLTLVSAMRHANPKAVTLLLSAFPEMDAAAHAILLQADEILVKPIAVSELVKIITQRLTSGPAPSRVIESVATILERSTDTTIEDWYRSIEQDRQLMKIPMTQDQRCSHLPQVFRDLVLRLRSTQVLGSKELISTAAARHGTDRRRRGYSAAMIVEESRMLQVSIFRCLQNNLPNIDFRVLLIGVMTIADEVDSQLSQAMQSYVASEPTSRLNPSFN